MTKQFKISYFFNKKAVLIFQGFDHDFEAKPEGGV